MGQGGNGKEADGKTDRISYEELVQNGKAAMPWPLMRNHVYRIDLAFAPGAEPAIPSEKNPIWGTFSGTPSVKDDPDWPKVLNKDGITDKGWSNKKELFDPTKDTELKLSDGSIVQETAGIKFKVADNTAERINFEYDVFDTSKFYLRLEKSTIFTFPRLPVGSYITIVGKVPVTSNESTDRFIKLISGDLTYMPSLSNEAKVSGDMYYVYGYKASGKTGYADYRYTYVWRVNSWQDKISFQISSTGGLAFEKFLVTEDMPSGINFFGDGYSGVGVYTRGVQTAQPNFIMKTEDLYSKSIKFDQKRNTK